MAQAPKPPADEQAVPYPGLPAGWEVRSYTNPRGRLNYAVYVDGRRVSFGIGRAEGAVRAAERLLGQRATPERGAAA